MAQIHNDKKRRIYRPEIEIEYESITQIPIILLTICRFGIRKMNLNLLCGEHKLGVMKMWVIPKYRFKLKEK
jgi:hypothetical protein